MADSVLVNPYGVDAAQGNEVYTDIQLLRFVGDPAGNTRTVSTVSAATAAVITTSAAHGYVNGQSVTISGIVMSGATPPNGTYAVTVLSATTFSVPFSTIGGTYTSGGTVVGTFQVGQLMVLQNWNGLVSSNAAASPYPTCTIAPLSVTATLVGVCIGGNTLGSIPTLGGIVQIAVSGLAQVLCDATTTAGTNLISSAVHPGQAATGAATNTGNVGTTTQVVTVSGQVPQLCWTNLKPS